MMHNRLSDLKHRLAVKSFSKRASVGAAAIALWGICLCCGSSPDVILQVRPGIEVIVSDSAHITAGKRVGLLTNQTGVNSEGTADVEVLLDAGVDLRAIFSPEHGFRGQLDAAQIDHATDSATGLPIFSLYGERFGPSHDMLELIDVLLIDLQDIGARTYTYISAALHSMRASADAGVSVVILDRPNPIGGVLVQGPILDMEFSSYVGMLPIPLRHGMTMGELAVLGDSLLDIGSDLKVIPAIGWRRDQWFDETGLPWVRPSPNMPDLESATHYPGMVLFEGTNISVGRGTPVAFQVLGAPWFEPRSILGRVEAEPGVAISDTVIKPLDPADGKFPDELLPALEFRVTDRSLYDPTRLAVRLLAAIRAEHGDSLRLTSGLDRLAGSAKVGSWIENGRSYQLLYASWESDVEEFKRIRDRFLIYR